MALATHNITGTLKDALGGTGRGRVTFRPYASHDARLDPATGDVLLGSIVEDIETLPTPYPLTAGAWRITIESTTRVQGRPEFSPIVTTLTLDGDYSWEDILAGEVTDVPVTPTVLQQAQAAADEAEMWASSAGDVQDTAVATHVTTEGSATSAALEATYATRTTLGTPASIQDATTITAAGDGQVRWMSADGERLFAFADGSAILRDSTDGGATWRALHTFGAQLGSVRELANGELIVCVRADPGEMWVSTGYDAGAGGAAATWAKTLTMSTVNAYADNRYSYSPPMHHMDDLPDGANLGVLLVGEYGTKADPYPDKVHLTEDYGQTWRIIFDPASGPNHHHHGCAYDPWGDAMWVSVGDGSVEKQVAYSTDWRNATPTWTQVALGTAQPVAIWPLRDCILLGSDAAPNGIHRIERVQGPAGYGPLTTPYRTDQNNTSLTYLVQTMFKRPGHPLLLAFAPAVIGGAAGDDRGFLVFTGDGREFTEVWRDTQEYTDTTYGNFYGVIGAVGPTAQGTVVAHLRDDFRGSGAFPYQNRLTAPWPEFAEYLPDTAAKKYADTRVASVAPEAWQAMTLTAAAAQRTGFYPVAARDEQGDVTRLRGQLTFVGTYTSGTDLFYLPADLRPVYSTILDMRTSIGPSSIFISASTGGVSVLAGGAAGSWVALDGLTFTR